MGDFPRIIVALASIGMLAAGAGTAHAAPAAFDCAIDTFADETMTGGQDIYTGLASGYLASGVPGNAVSLRCYVTVNGAEVASTPAGTGTTFAQTAGQVTYTATDTDDVDVCAEWWDGSEGGSACYDTETMQVPPQEVIDLLTSVYEQTAVATPRNAFAPVVCGSLPPGDYGDVDIDDDGDVYVQGSRTVDCPPYGDPHPWERKVKKQHKPHNPHKP